MFFREGACILQRGQINLACPAAPPSRSISPAFPPPLFVVASACECKECLDVSCELGEPSDHRVIFCQAESSTGSNIPFFAQFQLLYALQKLPCDRRAISGVKKNSPSVCSLQFLSSNLDIDHSHGKLMLLSGRNIDQ